MTRYTSNDVVPPAIRNLISLLDDEPALHEVAIAYGPVRDIEREHIFIGDSIDEDDIDWASVGNPVSRNLEFVTTFTVTVVAANPGDGPQESLERAYEMRGVVESVLRAQAALATSPTVKPLDLPQEMGVRLLWARQTHQFIPNDEGIGCDAGLVVRISARL